MGNTYVYMHVCFLEHWDNIVNDLFEMLEEFDVYTRVSEIRICSLGNKTHLSHDIWNRHSKIRLYAHDENVELYERFTLNILRNDALCTSENFNVFYLHSKESRNTINTHKSKVGINT